MERKDSVDWWRWELNRSLAEHINRPNDITEAKLKSLLLEYRRHWERNAVEDSDEHEWAMDFH